MRVRAETLEVYQGTIHLLTIPRLLGERQHRIDYRHLSASLARKPGAFAQSRYRDDLFPTRVFRQAYDGLVQAVPHRADRDYVRLLHLAAGTSEAAVEAVLAEVLGKHQAPTFDLVRDRLRLPTPVSVPELTEAVLDFAAYDDLLAGEMARG